MKVQFIISDYINSAMALAEYDKLEDGSFAGKIPKCKGVISFGSTLKECQIELRSTLEDWILVGIKLGHPLPIVDKINLNKKPVETADINVRGTVNVFEACRINNVKKVIYAESSAMYEGSELLPTPEIEVKPQSFYSVSKFATMYFAEAYARFYGKTERRGDEETGRREDGMKFTALRYFCVYGPRQDYRRTIPPVFSSFIIKLLKGEQPIIFGTGEKRRDFVYVDDINDFHIQCMEDDRTTGKVFNLGSGINYSINDIYKIISDLLESDVKPLYMHDQPGEAFANLADVSEAKKLGWKPKTDLILGLKASIEFIKKEIETGRV